MVVTVTVLTTGTWAPARNREARLAGPPELHPSLVLFGAEILALDHDLLEIIYPVTQIFLFGEASPVSSGTEQVSPRQ